MASSSGAQSAREQEQALLDVKRFTLKPIVLSLEVRALRALGRRRISAPRVGEMTTWTTGARGFRRCGGRRVDEGLKHLLRLRCDVN